MSGFSLEQRRLSRFRRLKDCPLREYYAWPFPRPSRDYRDVEYVAVDLETTGLDARRDQILSIGWVVLSADRIRLDTAHHRLLRVDGEIPAASAVIHQITDDEAATGLDPARVLPDLLWELSGRVLLAHHARIEIGFLSALCKRLWGEGLLIRAVDTQAVARRLLERRQIPFKGSDLRLHALCERYNLPRHGAHNALSDALSAAELFLAQAAHRDTGHRMVLRDFL
jgi:DNA polymerase-3 subunit epsilon